jgi:hypothetical protein
VVKGEEDEAPQPRAAAAATPAAKPAAAARDGRLRAMSETNANDPPTRVEYLTIFRYDGYSNEKWHALHKDLRALEEKHEIALNHWWIDDVKNALAHQDEGYEEGFEHGQDESKREIERLQKELIEAKQMIRWYQDGSPIRNPFLRRIIMQTLKAFGWREIR